MGLLDLFKRTASGQTTPLSTTQVDSNWQKIMDLFPTPAAGTTDIGKVPALKADKTGFNYAPVISSIIPGANISIDVTDPNNPVISAISNAMQSSKYLIAGGSVWSGTGLTYDVTAINYYFNGNKTADATQITLSASDPTNDRVDAIVVDESGVISIIEGVAASPALVPPIPLDQLLIQYVVVKATTTEPVIVEEAVYLDNDEWTTSTFNLPGTAIIGSTDFEATGVPKQGTKFISNVGRNQNTVLRFAHAGALNINDFTTASFWVRLPQTLPNGCNIVAGLSMDGLQYSGIVPLSLFGLKNNITNAWQLVVIPMSISTLTVFNQLVIGVIGNTSGINYDIDAIKLSNGSISVINAPEMSIYKNGAYVGKKSNLNFVEDDGVELDVTENALQNRIDVKIKAEGGGGDASYIPPYLKTGGASWSGTGLVYDVTALEYYFNGDKNTSATQVTLDASDPVNNRLDAIVVDEAGVVSVIKGDASASPISPSVDESHILVQYILVEAGSTQPTIAKEDIYLENVEWTTSTYTTGTATGSIDFDNAVSPKQGIKCISANADARLGARFVRATSFDPYQYTMLSMWVRFTGSNVATNKSLNVRFENGAGALVANTINLFNFGLQRNLLNVWQLVVIPITSFGVLPTSVKGLKIIMAGGTVGQARQWDIDLISLTDNSVPSINEQAFNILKDGALVGQSSTINFKGAVTVTNDPINKKIDVEVIGGGGGSPGGSDNQIQINQSGAFFADSSFQKSDTGFNVGFPGGIAGGDIVFTGSGLDDFIKMGTFVGSAPITYTATVDGLNQAFLQVPTYSITGGSFSVSDTITNGTGGSSTILSISTADLFGTEMTILRVTINSGSFSHNDTIDNGSGVTAFLEQYVTSDTITWTDGVTTVTNVPLASSNGILFGIPFFPSTHTVGDSWTWTYSLGVQNVLELSSNYYKLESIIGTDTFSYQIGDNLLGVGAIGSLNTLTSGNGDIGYSGFLDLGDSNGFKSNTHIDWGSGASSDFTLDDGYVKLRYDAGGVGFDITGGLNIFNIASIQGGISYGLAQSNNSTILGNLAGGNGTKITIDDVNEQITIGNIKAFDDDAAAGVGGLTAGMVYMTTGSGSAPLNAAGILMIKQ